MFDTLQLFHWHALVALAACCSSRLPSVFCLWRQRPARPWLRLSSRRSRTPRCHALGRQRLPLSVLRSRAKENHSPPPAALTYEARRARSNTQPTSSALGSRSSHHGSSKYPASSWSWCNSAFISSVFIVVPSVVVIGLLLYYSIVGQTLQPARPTIYIFRSSTTRGGLVPQAHSATLPHGRQSQSIQRASCESNLWLLQFASRSAVVPANFIGIFTSIVVPFVVVVCLTTILYHGGWW